MNTVKSPNHKINIAISWVELPAYAAHLIRAGIKRLEQPVTIVATIPSIPIEGMEEILGQKIHWIDKSNVNSWKDMHLPMPDIFFQAGWYIPSIHKLGNEVRSHGGKVVLLSDNCWKNNIRQWVGAFYVRLRCRKWFSAVWVPGKSGTQLQSFFGVPNSQIYQGLYGSDPDCFTAGPPLQERPKQFIFVGQFTARKGIAALVKAFKIFHQKFPDWVILLYGDGESRNILENSPGMVVHPFVQPPQIADALRRSRFLVLPSKQDHWPLVVSEATLAGCGLILSDRVGNRQEFLNEKNGFTFPTESHNELSKILIAAATLPDWRLNEVYNESKQLGSVYVPTHWAEIFHQIVVEVGSCSTDLFY